MLINLYLYNPPLAVWLHPTAELMPAFVRLWHPEPLIPLHNGLYFCVSLITNYLEHSPRICPKWEIDAEDLFFRQVFFSSSCLYNWACSSLSHSSSVFTPAFCCSDCHPRYLKKKKGLLLRLMQNRRANLFALACKFASLPCGYDSIMGQHLVCLDRTEDWEALKSST